MVTACNNHITANGTLSVWEQDYATVRVSNFLEFSQNFWRNFVVTLLSVQRKIADCIQLHDRYIENYQRESRRFEEQGKLTGLT